MYVYCMGTEQGSAGALKWMWFEFEQSWIVHAGGLTGKYLLFRMHGQQHGLHGPTV